MNDALLLDVPAACERLRIGRSKLYELIAAREIETVRIGRSVRIPAEALAEYVERLRQSVTA